MVINDGGIADFDVYVLEFVGEEYVILSYPILSVCFKFDFLDIWFLVDWVIVQREEKDANDCAWWIAYGEKSPKRLGGGSIASTSTSSTAGSSGDGSSAAGEK